MKTKFLKSIGLGLIGLSFLTACQNKNDEATWDITESKETALVEVIYFYGKQRCAACVAMERFAKEAIDSVFPEQVKNGTISFQSIDITNTDGEKLADSFEVTSSSLFIIDNSQKNPERVNMTTFGFRNARNNRQEYKQGVIDQINKFLD